MCLGKKNHLRLADLNCECCESNFQKNGLLIYICMEIVHN